MNSREYLCTYCVQLNPQENKNYLAGQINRLLFVGGGILIIIYWQASDDQLFIATEP